MLLEPANSDFKISRVDVLLAMGQKREARAALDAMVKDGTPRGLLREWYARCGR